MTAEKLIHKFSPPTVYLTCCGGPGPYIFIRPGAPLGTAASTLKLQRRAVAINVHGASTAVQDPSLRNRKITSDAIFHIVGTFGVCMSHLWARWGVGEWGGNAWLELSWKHVPKGLERKRKDTESVDAAVQVCQFIHLVNRVGPFYRTHGSCRVPPSQPPFPPGSPPPPPSISTPLVFHSSTQCNLK